MSTASQRRHTASRAVPAIPLAALIGVSRVLVGIHYFHDVLAGALVGTTMVIILAWWGTPPVGKGIAIARGHPFLERLLMGNRTHHRAVKPGPTSLHPRLP